MRLADVAAGSKPALARALARIEREAGSAETAALLDEALANPRGHVIGLTGPPGVGKSTLTDALIRALRQDGETVGVIAVDPSSRRSGGALLGDRTRLSRDPEDAGVFVRSMAARDRLGGLAELTFPAMVLMRALRDVVIVETVGVGQSETAIAGIADTVVFCAQPGAGDALQFMKAGVMEIPDIVAVTKADMGALAQRTVSDLRGALSLAAPGGAMPEVLAVSAARGEGIGPLIDAIRARRGTASPARRAAQARLWLEEHLGERYGREGLRRLGPAALDSVDSAPFERARRLSRALDAALDHLTPPG